MTWLRNELRLVFMALQFLTRLPVPRWVGYEPEGLKRAVRHFPLIGALVGAIGAAVAVAALQLWPPAVAATLATAAMVWLTAAFHEDGLADTFDALLGAASREKALIIMKDSRIGSYGAAALALVLLLRVLLLTELLSRGAVAAASALVAAHAAGRAAAVALTRALPYAGDTMQAKAPPLTRDTRVMDSVWAAFAGALALALAALMHSSSVPTFVGAAASLTGLVLLLHRWLERRLGGYTGDTLGAAEQLGEVVVLLAFVAQWSR